MCCAKNIYVLKYKFVVYKNICRVKLALWATSYFLNGRVTVSLTMLIWLSHESLDVRSFSAAVVRDWSYAKPKQFVDT